MHVCIFQQSGLTYCTNGKLCIRSCLSVQITRTITQFLSKKDRVKAKFSEKEHSNQNVAAVVPSITRPTELKLA